MFHRQFPDRRIKPGIIAKIYRMHGLTKKKVEVSCVAACYIEREPEFRQTTLALDDKINDIKKSGGHLVYIDEAVFKQRDMQPKAWSNKRMNLKVLDRTYY